VGKRADLAEFLKQRRAALEPARVGLPPGMRRRAPGLRREEVALLAGVSVTWYTWLEQGRDVNASRSVLDALARALLLDEAQHAHLLALASPMEASPAVAPSGPPPGALERLIEQLDPSPAYVLGPRYEYLAWNRSQGRLYRAEDLPPEERNLMWIVLCDPRTRALIVDWEAEAQALCSRFRADVTAIRTDPALEDLVERLLAASPEFARWWPRHDVERFHTRLRRYEHPQAGSLVFEYQQFTPDEWPGYRVVCQLPLPDDDSAQRLAALR
jgi:transcriptional regulator with XRE-family HTH domain